MRVSRGLITAAILRSGLLVTVNPGDATTSANPANPSCLFLYRFNPNAPAAACLYGLRTGVIVDNARCTLLACFTASLYSARNRCWTHTKCKHFFLCDSRHINESCSRIDDREREFLILSSRKAAINGGACRVLTLSTAVYACNTLPFFTRWRSLCALSFV